MACTGVRSLASKDVGAIEAAPASTVFKKKAREAIAPELSAAVCKDVGAIDAVQYLLTFVRKGAGLSLCIGAIDTVGKGKAGETIAPVLGAGASKDIGATGFFRKSWSNGLFQIEF